MVINKNNGKILIEEYNERSGFITSIKTIKSYNITVLDLEGIEKLKGRLRVQQLENRKNYRFTHNSDNKNLVNYIVEELRKHNYIK